MPDLSAAFATPALEQAFLGVVDVEGKLLAALEDLGPVGGRNVVLLDAGRGSWERQLAGIGAAVTAVAFPDPLDEAAALARIAELPAAEADTVVVPWSELAVPGSRFISEAQRLLRPCGRLLLMHDYGRDDVWGLWPERRDRVVAWSRRRGPFLGDGFRVRVIHCWWTFRSAEEARELLTAGFGPLGVELADRMKRLRLEYQVAVYHRWVPGPGPELEAQVTEPAEAPAASGGA
jgi:SAM-dependent methyltransferase